MDNALVNNPDPVSSHFLPGTIFKLMSVTKQITRDSIKTLPHMIRWLENRIIRKNLKLLRPKGTGYDYDF